MNIQLKSNNAPTEPGDYIYMIHGEQTLATVFQHPAGLIFHNNTKLLYIRVNEFSPSALWSDKLEFSI